MKRTFLVSTSIAVLVLCNRFFGAVHLTQVLERLGLEKADVDGLTTLADDAKDFKPEDYVTKVSTGFENKFLNDATFLGKLKLESLPADIKKTIEAGQYGRFINEFKALATKQGIDLADLTDEEQKSLSKLGTKAFEKYAGKLGTPDALQKVQADLQKALSDKTALETELPTKLETAKNTVKGEMQTQINKLVAMNELSGIKGFKVKPGLVVDGLLSSLSDKYTIVANGIKVSLMQKDQPTLKALGTDGKEITFAQALSQEAKEAELIGEVKEEEIDPRTGKVKVEVAGDEIKLPSYITDKMKDNLSLEAKK